MDILLPIVFAVAVLALLFLTALCLTAVLYESVFGKRCELFDAPLLPNLNDYPSLENEPVSFSSRRSAKRRYSYSGCFYANGNVKQYKGLIVFSHDISGGHLCYLPEIAYFAQRGYKIFAFDDTGCHLSGGRSLRGLPQAAEDIRAALDFIAGREDCNALPVMLFGHGLGGYAVCAVHYIKNYNVCGVFVQNGFNRCTEFTMDKLAAVFGRWVMMLTPYFKIYEKLKFGKRAKITARQGVARATAENTSFLILHTTDDGTVPLQHGVLANVDRNDRITLITEKNKGHDSFASDAATQHRTNIAVDFIRSGLPEKQKREFFASHADKKLYFELDERLIKIAADFFDVVSSEQ